MLGTCAPGRGAGWGWSHTPAPRNAHRAASCLCQPRLPWLGGIWGCWAAGCIFAPSLAKKSTKRKDGCYSKPGGMPVLEVATFLVMLCQVLALNGANPFCFQALHGAPAHPNPRGVSRFSSPQLQTLSWGWAGYMAVPPQTGFSVPVRCHSFWQHWDTLPGAASPAAALPSQDHGQEAGKGMDPSPGIGPCNVGMSRRL